MAQEGEPSVEEILDSIKKVIARDNRAGAAEQRRTRETRGMVELPALQEDTFDDEDVLDLGDESALADAPVPQPDEADVAPLVTEEARVSMQQSLAALAALSEPSARPQIVRSGETSLEELTRDLLRPALAEWLDTNLPAMVERMVASEISRIIGKRG